MQEKKTNNKDQVGMSNRSIGSIQNRIELKKLKIEFHVSYKVNQTEIIKIKLKRTKIIQSDLVQLIS